MYFISSIFLLTTIFIITLKRSNKIRYYYDKFILKIPKIGNLIKSYNLANSTRTMGLLLKSGITLSEALPVTSRISSNMVYKEEFNKIAIDINRGERMSSQLSKSRNFFPDVFYQIVSVGERSGNLSNSLLYLSEHFESEVEDFTKNISTLIEPVLMIIMGVMVGFIAISIITPIYGITQHLQPK